MLTADEPGDRGAGATKTKAPGRTTAAAATVAPSASFMEITRMVQEFSRSSRHGQSREQEMDGSGTRRN